MEKNLQLKQIKASVANLYQENGCTVIFVNTPTKDAQTKEGVYFLNNFLFFENRPIQKATDTEIANLLYAMTLEQAALMQEPVTKIIRANYGFMKKAMTSTETLFQEGNHLDLCNIKKSGLKLNKKSKLPVNNLLNQNIDEILKKLSQLRKQGIVKNFSLYSLQDSNKVRLALYGNRQDYIEQASINSCLAIDYCASFMAFNLTDFFRDLLKICLN